MGKNAIFTIVSKNYISYARVLMNSFRKYHTDWDCLVLLVDKIEGYFDPYQENFKMIEIEQLEIPNEDSLIFKYNIMELNTAVKPFFIEHLFKNQNYETILYFDPDILILKDLSHLFKILKEYSILLIPHITSPIPEDGKQQSEIDIMRAGCYNLGFIGLSHYEKIKEFLKWWQERLSKYCFSAPEAGLFVDQKWIDLVPSMNDGVYILRHPGYNVAYWNLHERNIQIIKGEYVVNEKPLFFFHFSGIDINHLDSISKYQNRYKLNDIENLRGLFETYKKLLWDQGYLETKDWPYFYGFFDNGTKIQNIVRPLYDSLGEKAKAFGNPFVTSGEGSFLRWLNAPFRRHSRITNLLYYIYSARIDLQSVFPEIEGKDEDRFIGWAFSSLFREYGFEKIFLDPLEKDKSIEPVPTHGQRIAPKSRLEKLLWKYGMQHAAFIKRIPWIRGIAKKEHSRLYRKRTAYGNGQAVLHLQNRRSENETTKESASRVPSNDIGMNVAGYLDTESGVGEAARGIIRSLEKSTVRFVLNNLEQHWLRRNDKTYTNFSKENPYKINLLHVNADQVPNVFAQLGENYFKNRYNIGYWFWELSEFPQKWFGSFRYFNEIWVASDFLLDSISKVSPIPVVKIPISVEFKTNRILNRQSLGISDETFIFLHIFDGRSYFERKNPFALIEAFKNAYTDFTCRNSLLILKISNAEANPQLYEKLKSDTTGMPVIILNDYFNRTQIYDLLALSDCYVSLHRSEGFGLPLAEAMYLGKPVIATAYSGNMEFMTINNNFPIKYKLVEIEKDVGPYEKGNVWADPDVDHAAELMRYVYQNRENGIKIGEIASEDVKNQLSPEMVAKMIRRRIERIL